MDSRLQRLKRHAGHDEQAKARLNADNRRRGLLGECPLSLQNAKVGPKRRLKGNRNMYRLWAHKQNKCGVKCRFCRRYGPYKSQD